MKILYFTASGNSLAAAKEFGGELLSIPQMVKQGVYEFADDKIGVVCPVYGFDMPRAVKAFLKKAVIKTDYFFVVGTYGDRLGGFSKKVCRLLKKTARAADYINAVRTVDNAVHAGYEIKNQIETLPDKKVAEQLSAIKADIDAGKKYIVPPANAALSALVYFFTPLMDAVGGAKMLSVDAAACTKCGTCAKVCPAGNITVNDAVCYGKNCELCLACLHNCPQKAIHIKREKSGERYRNPAVSLKEIIESNSRIN